MAAELDFEDRRDFEEAARGLIAPLPDGGGDRRRRASRCGTCRAFAFITQGAEAPGDGEPEPVAPDRSSWSRAGCTRSCRVCTRSATPDLSNITIAEGDDGIVVFDPLISTETAARGDGALLRRTGPASRSWPSCYSHSHVDHYGGVTGHRRRGRRRAPARSRSSRRSGFLEAAIAENVLAGQRDEPPGQLHVRQPAARPTPRARSAPGSGWAPRRARSR